MKQRMEAQLGQPMETTIILGIPFCRWPMSKVVGRISAHIHGASAKQFSTKQASVKEASVKQVGVEEVGEGGSLGGRASYLPSLLHVVTANPEIVMGARENPQLRAALLAADLITPDGTGIVWAADYIGQAVSERVAGYDLLHELCRTAEERPFSIYILGAQEETNAKATEKLASLYPQLHILGRHNGYFNEEEEQDIIEEINHLRPDLLLVALGFPRQETWLYENKEKLQVSVAIGVGGSLDVLAGVVKRAPQFWQRLRLEWLYRLLQEPNRFQRQLALPKFVLAMRREKKRVAKNGD